MWTAPGRWPCSHSESSRTSTIGRGAGGQGVDLLRGDFADLGAGLAKEVGVGLRHGAGWAPVIDGLAPVRRQGGEGRVDGAVAAVGRAGVRPAGDTCSGARSAVMRSASRALGAGVARGGRAEVAEHVLERVVAEHRALQAGRADLDAEQVEQVVGAERRDLGRAACP